MEKNWYNQSPDEALKNLSTTKEKGLSQDEAKTRLEKYGDNALAAEKKKSFGEKLKEQILDPMIIILIAAACSPTKDVFTKGQGHKRWRPC